MFIGKTYVNKNTLTRGCQYKNQEGAEMLNRKSYENGMFTLMRGLTVFVEYSSVWTKYRVWMEYLTCLFSLQFNLYEKVSFGHGSLKDIQNIARKNLKKCF